MQEIEVILKIKMEAEDPDGDINDTLEYPSFDCPSCQKGIVTIGNTMTFTIPEGILASNNVGEIKFEHYTCDRCNLKILTTDNEILGRAYYPSDEAGWDRKSG